MVDKSPQCTGKTRTTETMPRGAMWKQTVVLGMAIAFALAPLFAAGEETESAGSGEGRWIEPFDQSSDYRSLRAGEAFRTSLFGFDVDEEARDRRSTSALDLGAVAYFDGP